MTRRRATDDEPLLTLLARVALAYGHLVVAYVRALAGHHWRRRIEAGQITRRRVLLSGVVAGWLLLAVLVPVRLAAGHASGSGGAVPADVSVTDVAPGPTGATLPNPAYTPLAPTTETPRTCESGENVKDDCVPRPCVTTDATARVSAARACPPPAPVSRGN